MVKSHHLNNRLHVAVIGGNGFVGRHVIQRMSQQPNLRIWSLDQRDHDVHIDTSESKAIIEQISLNLNIRDNIHTFLSTHSLDYIIYCAGTEGVTDGISGNIRKEIDQLTGLANTLDSLKTMYKYEGENEQSEMPYFMYLSSWSVYGFNRKKISDEKASTVPNNYNGMIKLTAEDIVNKTCQRYNMPCCILRPTEIFGRHDHKQLGKNNTIWRGFISHYTDNVISSISERGREVSVFSPDMVIDPVHVNYVAKVILNFMANGITGTYNVSSGSPVTMMDLVMKIDQACNEDSSVVFNPSQKLKIEDMTVDSSKVRSLVPYDKDNYNLDRFIKNYVPIRREEIARDMAIEQIMSEKYLFDTTAHGAKEGYVDRQAKRKVEYAKIKKIAGNRFDKIQYARFNERAVELLENREPKLVLNSVTKDKEKLLEKTKDLELLDPMKELEHKPANKIKGKRGKKLLNNKDKHEGS